ncbi:MAG: hypothetical protein MPW17_16125 [Candidatus Manganitrophus sp.]|nr:MAG: hypothetical protein MPW17_16125 [Candidatus Manganitrophus sp.]
MEGGAPGSLKEARNVFEKKYILAKLQENSWNVNQTAEALQIERTYLYRKMKFLGIEAPGGVKTRLCRIVFFPFTSKRSFKAATAWPDTKAA